MKRKSEIKSDVSVIFNRVINQRLDRLEFDIIHKVDNLISSILRESFGITFYSSSALVANEKKSVIRKRVEEKLAELDSVIDKHVNESLIIISKAIEKTTLKTMKEYLDEIIYEKTSDAMAPIIERIVNENIEAMMQDEE